MSATAPIIVKKCESQARQIKSTRCFLAKECTLLVPPGEALRSGGAYPVHHVGEHSVSRPFLPEGSSLRYLAR